MTLETWKRLEDHFAGYPDLQAGSVSIDDVVQAERTLVVTLPSDYREFICRFGGAIVGSLPVYGVRRAKLMGKSEASFVDVTRCFRKQGWPGVEDWVIFSMDNSGNPVGFDAAGAVWISDHDAGSIQKLADDFEGYIVRWCLSPDSH